MVLAWPSGLVTSSENWRLTGGARSGGPSLTGEEQSAVGPSARWRATLAIPVYTPAKILALRGLMAALDGRANTVLVGPFEVTRAPWFIDPLTGNVVTYKRGEQDASLDPAYDANPDTSADLDFRVAAPAAVNSTQMTVQRNRGGFLAPGMIFSVAGRLHVIAGLTTADPVDERGMAAAGTVGISFRPWLRLALPAGTPLEFGRPVGVMRNVSDETDIELQLSRYGTVTVELVEG